MFGAQYDKCHGPVMVMLCGQFRVNMVVAGCPSQMDMVSNNKLTSDSELIWKR